MIAPAALLSAAILAAAPARGPYLVLRADGSEIRLMEPPRQKGALLVGRLWPEGTLVSFPAREVDRARTDAANAPGAPPPTATPAGSSLGEVVQRAGRPTPVPLGRLARLNRPRAEAERELTKASGTGRAEERPDAEASAARPRRPAMVPEHVDVNGRGEEWWRSRARALHDEIADAKAELAAAEADAVAWERGWMPSGQAERSSWAWELQRRRDAAERARARVAAAQRRMSDLEDEARRDDAYPGWLR